MITFIELVSKEKCHTISNQPFVGTLGKFSTVCEPEKKKKNMQLKKSQPMKGQGGGKASNSRSNDDNILLSYIGLSFDDW